MSTRDEQRQLLLELLLEDLRCTFKMIRATKKKLLQGPAPPSSPDAASQAASLKLVLCRVKGLTSKAIAAKLTALCAQTNPVAWVPPALAAVADEGLLENANAGMQNVLPHFRLTPDGVDRVTTTTTTAGAGGALREHAAAVAAVVPARAGARGAAAAPPRSSMFADAFKATDAAASKTPLSMAAATAGAGDGAGSGGRGARGGRRGGRAGVGAAAAVEGSAKAVSLLQRMKGRLVANSPGTRGRRRQSQKLKEARKGAAVRRKLKKLKSFRR